MLPTINNKDNFFVYSIVVIFTTFHILSAFSMFTELPVGAITSAFILIIILINHSVIIDQYTKCNIIFGLYFLIMSLSLLNYGFNQSVINYTRLHEDSLVKSISYLVLPVLLFYFAGRYVETKNKTYTDFIIDKIVMLNAASVAVGIVLFMFPPDFYRNYIVKAMAENLNVEAGFYPRLVGYYGNSMLIGVVCSSSIPLTFSIKRNYIIKSCFLFIFLLGSAMTLQRGSWLAAIFGLAFCLLYYMKSNQIIVKHIVYIVTIFAILITISIFIMADYLDKTNIPLLISTLGERNNNLTSMVGERSYQWDNVEKVLSNYPLGTGIGMLSHVTAQHDYELAIPDGNYFRIVGELGPLGLLTFVALLIVGIIKGILSSRQYFSIAIIIYSLQAVGTNVFDFYYASYIFWFILGILFNANTINTTY